MRLSSIRQFVMGAALAGVIGIGGAIGMNAQDDSTPGDGHPAHIHVGTCADLDPSPLAGLNNLFPIGVERGEDADEPERRGVLSASVVTYSETEDIAITWDAMLGAPHSIVVHQSEDQMETLIACGEIGGVVFDDHDELVVGLHQVGDSGYFGIAMVSSDGDDGDNVEVDLYLVAPHDDTEPQEGITATPEG